MSLKVHQSEKNRPKIFLSNGNKNNDDLDFMKNSRQQYIRLLKNFENGLYHFFSISK
jgi:hypothetical protein